MEFENEYRKKQRKPQSSIFNFLQNPFWVNLIIGYIVILVLSIPFSLGYQIYPKKTYFSSTETDPECRTFTKVGYSINGSFLNLSYTLNSDNYYTYTSAFCYFRIFLDGPYYKEELRHQNIEGRFRLHQNTFGSSYELLQEGKTDVKVKCLDRDLHEDKIEIKNLSLKSKYTVIHSDKSVSNVCFSNGKNILFLRNNVKSVSERLYELLHPFKIVNSSIDDHLSNSFNRFNRIPRNNEERQINSDSNKIDNNENSENNDENESLEFVELKSPIIDLYHKTNYETISVILPNLLKISENYDSFLFNSMSEKDSKIGEFIEQLINKPLIKNKEPILNYCYRDELPKPFLNNLRLENDEYETFKQTVIKGKTKEDNQLYVSIAQNDFLSSFSNREKIEEIIGGEKGRFQKVNFSEMTFTQKIESMAKTKVLISADDGDEITNAFWMPKNSTLIVLLEMGKRLSDAVYFIKNREINVFPIVYKGADFDRFSESASENIEIPLEAFKEAWKSI